MKKNDRIIIRLKCRHHGLRGTITCVYQKFINVLWDDEIEETTYSYEELEEYISRGFFEIVELNEKR